MTEPQIHVPTALIRDAVVTIRCEQYDGPLVRRLEALIAQSDESIADPMVPGTTFWGRPRDGVLSSTDRLWFVDAAGYVFSIGAHHIDGKRIDPSTIRDVTPPAVTS